MNNQRACIFANGIVNNTHFICSRLNPDDILIAADGGSKLLAELGLFPHVLIGDLDSTPEQELLHLTSKRYCMVLRYPQAKNETDLELALRYAFEQNVTEILIFGSLGGRWDMSFANVFLLTLPYTQNQPGRNIKVTIVEPDHEIILITPQSPLRIDGKPDDIVSLIPLSTSVEGIVTQNLLYPLKNETLSFGSTRGISNVMIADHANIQIQFGFLLCVHIPKNDRD